MSAVTAMCPLRESFISSGELLRRDVGGPAPAPVIVEENVARAALRLFSTCLGPAGHFVSMMLRMRPFATSVPIMGPGATVGLVGTRVPMDLSVASQVILGRRILLSPRRKHLGRPRGKGPRGALSTEDPLGRHAHHLSPKEMPSP